MDLVDKHATYVRYLDALAKSSGSRSLRSSPAFVPPSCLPAMSRLVVFVARYVSLSVFRGNDTHTSNVRESVDVGPTSWKTTSEGEKREATTVIKRDQIAYAGSDQRAGRGCCDRA